MKILLVQPASSDRMVGFSRFIQPEPLALEILAATVTDHEVDIFDRRVDKSDFAGKLASFAPDVVGITGYTTDVPRMRAMCQQVKAIDRSIITILGGVHASLCPEDFDSDDVDVIVVGEGENAFPQLIATIDKGGDYASLEGLIYRKNGRAVTTPPRQPAKDLDALPMPARHLTDKYRSSYHFHFWDNPRLVETARGCPFRCTFCSVWKFHDGKCRLRHPDRVIQELDNLKAEVICFVDDNFLQHLPRAEEIGRLVLDHGIKTKFWCQARADGIVRRPDIITKWAKAGLTTILIGFEKFREEELASVNKSGSIRTNEKAMEIMHENGVEMWGAFIVDPQWTRPDFDALIDYVRSMKITFPQFTILTPLPGTDFFKEKVGDLITKNYEVFDFLHTVLPTKLPLDEFYANMARLYSSTTLSLSELKQRIRSGLIPVSALQRVKGLLVDVTSADAYMRSVQDLVEV